MLITFGADRNIRYAQQVPDIRIIQLMLGKYHFNFTQKCSSVGFYILN